MVLLTLDFHTQGRKWQFRHMSLTKFAPKQKSPKMALKTLKKGQIWPVLSVLMDLYGRISCKLCLK